MLPRVFMKEEPGFFFFLLEPQRCVSVVVLFWICPCWAKKSYFMLRNSPPNLFLISLLLPTELYFLPDLSAQHNKPLLENMDINTLHNVFFLRARRIAELICGAEGDLPALPNDVTLFLVLSFFGVVCSCNVALRWTVRIELQGEARPRPFSLCSDSGPWSWVLGHHWKYWTAQSICSEIKVESLLWGSWSTLTRCFPQTAHR